MFLKCIILLVLLGVIMSAPLLSIEEEWTNFKTKHNKSYESAEEEQKRFHIFRENFNKIKEHNEKYEKGETTFTQGINQFADLTQEEFRNKHLGGLRKPEKGLLGSS